MKFTPGAAIDERGAVFVEKLIVYLPLLLVFFLSWELAELGAASIVVQRASAAAGRAAVVVLADDPVYYEGEEVGSYGGQRRSDIELAAGMILSAIPRLSSDFVVDVAEPSDVIAPLEVSLTANYDCGVVSVLCGADDAIPLSSTTTHLYHGAKYDYTLASTDLSGGGAALLRRKGFSPEDFDGDEYGEQEYDASTGRYRAKGKGGGKKSQFEMCKKMSEDELGKAGVPKFPKDPDPNMGNKLTGAYGQPGTASYYALLHRCMKGVDKAKNVAVATYQCEGLSQPLIVAAESGWEENPNNNMSPGAPGAPGTPENWDHSEQNVLRRFQKVMAQLRAQGIDPGKCKVTNFYTERDPCYNSGGASCQNYFNHGGTDLTKAPDVQMTPAEIKALKQKISFHFEYNNNFRQFDKATCNDKSVKKPPDAQKFCDRLAKKDEVCKKAGFSGDVKNCNQAEKYFNDRWKKEQNADKAWEKSKEYYEKNKDCKPELKDPPKPDHKNDLKENDVRECLEIANLEEQLGDPTVRNKARDDIAAAMKAQCAALEGHGDDVFEPRPATPNPLNP